MIVRIFISSVQKELTEERRAIRDYTNDASVQVMLFADRLEVWNLGAFPRALTIAQLRRPHASIPLNPLIARCREPGLPAPQFRQEGGQFIQTLPRPTPQVTAQVVKIMDSVSAKALSREELQSPAGMADRENFQSTYFEPLVTAGWLKRAIPDKPTSRFQKYRLTENDRAWLTTQAISKESTK